jgi:hypothetical protein
VSDVKLVAAGTGRVEDDEERMPQPLDANVQMPVRRRKPNLVLSVTINIIPID